MIKGFLMISCRLIPSCSIALKYIFSTHMLTSLTVNVNVDKLHFYRKYPLFLYTTPYD